MKATLIIQIICLCITLVLIALAAFVFKNMTRSDYVLIVVALLDAVSIVFTVRKMKKQ